MNRTFRFVSHQMPFSRDVLMIDENRNTYFLKPERSQAVRNHSPDGFNWGYAGPLNLKKPIESLKNKKSLSGLKTEVLQSTNTTKQIGMD